MRRWPIDVQKERVMLHIGGGSRVGLGGTAQDQERRHSIELEEKAGVKDTLLLSSTLNTPDLRGMRFFPMPSNFQICNGDQVSYEFNSTLTLTIC